MSTEYVVAVEGIAAIQNLEALSPAIRRAAMRAVNYATRRGRTESARRMRDQVAFGARYLTGQNGKLETSRPATPDVLEASITGRFRPTSLARFVKGNPIPGQAGVKVEVSPGDTQLMKRAFVLRLPQGTKLTETKYNLGLAIRLRPGETVENKRKMVKMGRGLFLLYGPSVDQVFSTVAEDVLPEVDGFLQDEFLRLIKVGDF